MRAPLILLISTLILSIGFLSAQPARACLSFDFAAEIAAGVGMALHLSKADPRAPTRVALGFLA